MAPVQIGNRRGLLVNATADAGADADAGTVSSITVQQKEDHRPKRSNKGREEGNSSPLANI